MVPKLVTKVRILLSILVFLGIFILSERAAPKVEETFPRSAVLSDWQGHGEDIRCNTTIDQPKAHRAPAGILIGVRKGGTGAILRFLSLNPRIKSPPGEIGFFNHEHLYAKGAKWYLKQLPPVSIGEIAFEKTPDYVNLGSTAKRIHEFNPRQKMLVAIRDPVLRLVSEHYFHLCRMEKGYDETYYTQYLNKTFDEIVINQETGEVNLDYKPLNRSMYFDMFKEWLKYFPLNQFMILDGDLFIRENPAPHLRKIETFLGVPNCITDDMFYQDPDKGFYCFASTGCIEGKGHLHPKPLNSTMNKLAEFFRPHNNKFFSLIGQRYNWL